MAGAPFIRAVLVGVALAIPFGTPAGADVLDAIKRLMGAAFFTPACRDAANKMQIHFPRDPRAVVAAFARELSTLPPDVRAELSLNLIETVALAPDCNAAAILLVNVLRENDIAAEIALVGRPDWQAGVLVYIPALDLYVDPAAPVGAARDLDRRVRATKRMHLAGPSLTPLQNDPCTLWGCVDVLPPTTFHGVRVKTETIRIAPRP